MFRTVTDAGNQNCWLVLCYVIKPSYFRLLFCSLIMQLNSWPLLSIKKKTGGFQNVKYIAVPSRGSKLQVFKVRPSRDLNPGLPRESLNIGIFTHAGDPGSNPGQAELWRLLTLKPLKLLWMYFIFWENSNLFLFGQQRWRA